MKKEMIKKQSITQEQLLVIYFKKNPERDISHPEIVDWVTKEYKKRSNGKIFRDPDRGIRLLYQKGFLIKVEKGVYRYEPSKSKNIKLEDFSAKQKEEILKKGNYRCAICGLGLKEGEELHIDHIKPKDKGGKAEIENGQVLCSRHNFIKKNLKQTETGKKMFINLYELSKKAENDEIKLFCEQILEVYEKNNINGHIEWKK